ncbi:hypothetical protein EJ02DRAFT_453799 [Clathrospora elynae]|uniref:Uncharacterized protein n=1 Tax=Clathrospora elynae TaxID=706981 RepID=A0A6A5STH0_9PLEO|nr:hypothetical protein EJ02DRAFT_453799 [Clathrospora elynae]
MATVTGAQPPPRPPGGGSPAPTKTPVSGVAPHWPPHQKCDRASDHHQPASQT